MTNCLLWQKYHTIHYYGKMYGLWQVLQSPSLKNFPIMSFTALLWNWRHHWIKTQPLLACFLDGPQEDFSMRSLPSSSSAMESRARGHGDRWRGPEHGTVAVVGMRFELLAESRDRFISLEPRILVLFGDVWVFAQLIYFFLQGTVIHGLCFISRMRCSVRSDVGYVRRNGR